MPWDSFVVFHDDSIDDAMSTAVFEALARDSTVAMFDLGHLGKMNAR